MVDATTHGERVKASILERGLALWRAGETVSARAIGAALGLSHGAVLYHYGNADAMRSAIAAEAVRIGDAVIVPMLIAGKHPAADALCTADRRRYLAGC